MNREVSGCYSSKSEACPSVILLSSQRQMWSVLNVHHSTKNCSAVQVEFMLEVHLFIIHLYTLHCGLLSLFHHGNVCTFTTALSVIGVMISCKTQWPVHCHFSVKPPEAVVNYPPDSLSLKTYEENVLQLQHCGCVILKCTIFYGQIFWCSEMP